MNSYIYYVVKKSASSSGSMYIVESEAIMCCPSHPRLINSKFYDITISIDFVSKRLRAVKKSSGVLETSQILSNIAMHSKVVCSESIIVCSLFSTSLSVTLTEDKFLKSYYRLVSRGVKCLHFSTKYCRLAS